MSFVLLWTPLWLGHTNNHGLLNGVRSLDLREYIDTVNLAAELRHCQRSVKHDKFKNWNQLTVSTIMPVIWYGSALEAGLRSSK